MTAMDKAAETSPDLDADAPSRTNSAATPDEARAPLDAAEVRALREVGREWGPARAGRAASLPVDPSLHRAPELRQPARWGRLVHVKSPGVRREELEATSDDDGGALDVRSLLHRSRRVVLGPPLKSSAIVQARIRKSVALPVLSADALSSVAYGPQAMAAVLVLAGGAGLGWSLPIAAAIALLMLAVGLSYRQTIRAYQHGGGSYIVASENLGQVAGLVAAAGLITDYVLTVAVSISAGLAAVTSAIPSLEPAVVPLGIGVIAVLLAANLRGVRQAGALFAAPTYAFILAIALVVVVGLIHAAGRGFTALPRPAFHTTEAVGVLLVLRGFSSGATAMTGIEAISNSVPAFEPVAWRNARTTLSWMIGLLIAMFAGVIVVAELGGIVPNPSQTMLSQLAHLQFGNGAPYIYIQAATALILLLAANTAFNDFPRVMYLLAKDRFASTRFLKVGDRLAFNNGAILLSVAAAVLFVAFGGNTTLLIPLYAIGVFLAFTLSQAGMVVHWWRLRGSAWRRSIAFNAIGCALSAIVFVIAGITKFTAGGWLALVIVVAFTAISLLTRRHFDRTESALAVSVADMPDGESEEAPSQISGLAIVTVGHLDRATIRALAYATSLRLPVLAVHVSPSEEEATRFSEYWTAWGNHVPLQVVESPYRAVIPPTVAYIESLHAQRPDLTLTVIVPELALRHRWQRVLHDETAARLRRALEPLDKVVVTSVPFHV
jgi:amino acid transporter